MTKYCKSCMLSSHLAIPTLALRKGGVIAVIVNVLRLASKKAITQNRPNRRVPGVKMVHFGHALIGDELQGEVNAKNLKPSNTEHEIETITVSPDHSERYLRH